MSSILTSGTAIESLDETSLLKHALIIDDYPDDTSTAKDRQDASHSLSFFALLSVCTFEKDQGMFKRK